MRTDESTAISILLESVAVMALAGIVRFNDGGGSIDRKLMMLSGTSRVIVLFNVKRMMYETSISLLRRIERSLD